MATSRNQIEKGKEATSEVESTFKHLTSQLTDWIKRLGAEEEMSLVSRDRRRTFQGRHISKMKWEGREIEVVEGLLAYRREFAVPVETTRVGELFDCRVEEVSKIDELGIGTIALDGAVEPKIILQALTGLGEGILWIEPVVIDYGAATPNDPLFSQQWALKEIKAEAAWDLWKEPHSADANAVLTAIADSGIPIINGVLSHPDLSDTNRFVLGPNLIDKDDDPADDQGHGTHVVGIAAATSNNAVGISGLYSEGAILVIKAMNSSQPPVASAETFEKSVIEAVRAARERGVHLVMNYSGGGPPVKLREAAVKHLDQDRDLLIAAAGNNKGGPVDYPAAYSTKYPNVIGVGAVTRKRTRPNFASRGPELTVVAPGVDIISCLPNYRVTVNSYGYATKYDRMDGSSMATPMVSALAALIWSKWPHFTAKEVRERIIQTADPLGSPNDFGSGIINAEAALQ